MARTILVADDSPTIRKIVELTFSDTDIRVEVAESGREAMDRLDSLAPDLVLADVVMPDPSGYELCRTIKTSERPVPVVLLAGTFEPFDAELARECGADAHLVKPFESCTLREKVQLLLEPLVEDPVIAEQEPVDVVMAELSDAVEHGADVDVEDAAEEEPFDEQSAPDRPWTESTVAVAPELVDAVAEAVVERLSVQVIGDIAREVVPKLATEIIRERIRELEQSELEDGAERD